MNRADAAAGAEYYLRFLKQILDRHPREELELLRISRPLDYVCIVGLTRELLDAADIPISPSRFIDVYYHTKKKEEFFQLIMDISLSPAYPDGLTRQLRCQEAIIDSILK